jgi:ribonuclease R
VKERLGSLCEREGDQPDRDSRPRNSAAFSPSALARAEAAQPATLKGREDWRELPLVTIDPPDAKDHDDAVHAAPDPIRTNRGGYIVHVAIADVAFYVRPARRWTATR